MRLCSNESGDGTGRWLDVADLDGDGLEELLISEDRAWGDYYSGGGIRTAAHLMKAPFISGSLYDVAFATFQGSGESNGLDYWGSHATLLPAVGQIAVSGQLDWTLDHRVHLLDIPSSPPDGPIPASAAAASLYAGAPLNQLGVPATLSRCELSEGAPALCVGTINTNLEVDANYAGQVLLYELPVLAEFHVLDDARARYHGDPFDRADHIEGQHDVNGDGNLDLVIGAYFGQWINEGEQLGAVAVLLDPPDGDHRVWDVADATYTGVVSGANFGIDATGEGDLDGDGHRDLFVGAYFGESGAAYVFRGPHAGSRSAAEAEWQIVGRPGDWLGYAAVVGDMDGDGADDLAVAAPRSSYVGTEPGEVLIWPSPPPGVLDATTAPIVLRSGVSLPDAFGMGLEGGDFDGDGLLDLAIGAPRDPSVGAYAGSVTVVFGATL